MNFSLALHNQTHRHRLHSPGRQAAGHLGPEQRRDHIPNDPIQKASCLLSVYPILIKVGRFFKSLGDSFLGNFVEHHSLVAGIISANRFSQVPGYRLTLAIKVGSKINGVGVSCQFLQLVDHLFFAGQYLVVRLPTLFRVYPHPADQLLTTLLFLVSCFCCGRHLAGDRCLGCSLLGIHFGGRTTRSRQIPDMTDAGFHHEVLAQVLVDGLGLRWRLDNN